MATAGPCHRHGGARFFASRRSHACLDSRPSVTGMASSRRALIRTIEWPQGARQRTTRRERRNCQACSCLPSGASCLRGDRESRLPGGDCQAFARRATPIASYCSVANLARIGTSTVLVGPRLDVVERWPKRGQDVAARLDGAARSNGVQSEQTGLQAQPDRAGNGQGNSAVATRAGKRTRKKKTVRNWALAMFAKAIDRLRAPGGPLPAPQVRGWGGAPDGH